MFDPGNWYWHADDGRVFASQRQTTVPQGDAAYVAWLAVGRQPTPWPRDEDGEQTDAALADVLAPYGIHVSRKAAKAAAVNARRDAIIAGGYQHNFGASAGIRTLDQRGAQDAINWLGLKGVADAMIAAGDGAELIAIRDAADETFSASATVVSSAMVAMGVWRSTVIAHSWTLKDAIARAKDDAVLDGVEIEAGWPEA